MNKGYSGLPTFEFGGTLRYRGNSPTEFLLREEGIGHTRLQTTSTQKGQIGTIAKFAAIFNPADCEAIAKIRPPSRRTEDFVAWKAEKSGLFSVRSTYNIYRLDGAN